MSRKKKDKDKQEFKNLVSFSKAATTSKPAKIFQAYKEEQERRSERERWETESGFSARSSVRSSARKSVLSRVSFSQAPSSSRSHFQRSEKEKIQSIKTGYEGGGDGGIQNSEQDLTQELTKFMDADLVDQVDKRMGKLELDKYNDKMASYRSPRPSSLGTYRLQKLHNISGLSEQLRDQSKFEKDPEEDTLLLSEFIGADEAAEAFVILQNQIIKGKDTLDISKLALNDLRFLQDHTWHQLCEINVSKCMLQENALDVLRIYPNLEIIIAAYNQIRAVNFCLNVQEIHRRDNKKKKNRDFPFHRLKRLDLSYNILEMFPNISACVKLRKLNLMGNFIKEIHTADRAHNNKLMELNLQRNEIDLPTRRSLYGFIQDLKSFEKLKKLNIEENPILSGEPEFGSDDLELKEALNDKIVEEFILEYRRQPQPGEKGFTKLELSSLNQISTKEFMKRVLDYEAQQLNIKRNIKHRETTQEEEGEKQTEGSTKKEDDPKPDEGEQGESPTKQKKVKDVGETPPHLLMLINILDQANSQPRSAQQSLEKLAKMAQKVIERKGENEENLKTHFAPIEGSNNSKSANSEERPFKSNEEVFETIETFMHNCSLLIDNYNDLKGIIMTILAKLGVIEYFGLGQRCYKALADFMRSGRELEDTVAEVVTKEIGMSVIPYANDLSALSVSVLQGLHLLVEQTENSHILSVLYQKCFPTWLNNYCDRLKEAYKKRQRVSNDERYDAVLSLISISVQDDDINVELFSKGNMRELISLVLKMTLQEHNRYIPVLELVACLSNHDDFGSEFASYFIQENCHVALLSYIETSMKNYFANVQFCKRGGNTIPPQPSLLRGNQKGESADQKIQRYRIVAAEIKCIGGFLQAKDKEERKRIWAQPVCRQLLSCSSHELTDPILLTAVCTFALDLFECKDILDDEKVMNPFYIELKNMEELMPYLGFDKYRDLEKMARRYETEEDRGKRQISESIRMEELAENGQIQNDAVDDESVDDSQKVNESMIIKEDLKHIEAQQNDKNKLFDILSEALNDMGREKALFNMICINNDDLRLAVVCCLYTVPPDELEMDELTNIVDIVGNCSNVGTGNTESVIAVVHWIFFKLTEVDFEHLFDDDYASSLLFQERKGHEALNLSLKILDMNTDETRQDEDDEEKYLLSLSILNFWKCASRAPRMQVHIHDIKDKSNILKRLLRNEDLYSSPKCSTCPIDIENTALTFNIQVLIDMIQDPDCFEPYCDVFLRILMRMADILMFRNDFEVDPLDTGMGVDDTCLRLDRRQEARFKFRKYQEANFWIDPPESFLKSPLEGGIYLDDKSLETLKQQHEVFFMEKGIEVITKILTERNPSNDEKIVFLTDPKFKDMTKNKNRGAGKDDKTLREKIVNEKQRLEQEFKKKWMHDYGKDGIYQIRKLFLEEFLEENQDNQQANEEENKQEQQPKVENDNIEEQSGKGNQTARQDDKIDLEKIQQENMEDLAFDDLINDQFSQGVGQHYGKMGIIILEDTSFNRESNEMSLQQTQLQEQRQRLDQGIEKTFKENRNDGILNREMRSLTVAAYLRMINAAIEFAPAPALRKAAVGALRNPDVFWYLTQLCDITDWDPEKHIISKYLRVTRAVVKLPFSQPYVECDSVQITFLEIVSKVITLGMKRIKKKRDDDIPLTEGDQVTNYELCLTMFTVIQQSNYIRFSQIDLIYAHLINEEEIAYLVAKSKDKYFEKPDIIKHKGEKGSLTEYQILNKIQMSLLEDYNKDNWIKKCNCQNDKAAILLQEQQSKQLQQQDQEKHNEIKMNMIPWVRKKMMTQVRPIQAQLVEFMVIEIFSKGTIFGLLEYLFGDMAEDQEALNGPMRFVDEDEVEEVKEQETKQADQKANQSELEDSDGELPMDDLDKEIAAYEEDLKNDDVTRYDTPVGSNKYEQYISLKGTLVVEKIKDIAAEVMSTCEEKLKFDILQVIFKGVMYKNKILRDSFMQEILRQSDIQTYKFAIQKYMNQQQLTCAKYFHDQNQFEEKRLAKILPKDEDADPLGLDQGGTEKPAKSSDYDPINPPFERVIEMTGVDINNRIIKHRCSDGNASIQQEKLSVSKANDDGLSYADLLVKENVMNNASHILDCKTFKSDRIDNNFYKRDFLVTSQGIQIMKLLPDEHECENKCLDDVFCPRGPVQDFCIAYNQIHSIITFGQMPQKFVIIYTSQSRRNKEGSIVEKELNQLTVICKLYTKCARISRVINTAVGGTPRPPKPDNEEDLEDFLDERLEGKFCKWHYDKIVTIELDVLVDFIFMEDLQIADKSRKPSKADLRDKELMLVSYQSFTINSKTKDEKNVETVNEERVKNMSKLKSIQYGKQKHHWNQIGTSFDAEDSLNIGSCVNMLVVSGYLIVIKEHWHHWEQYTLNMPVRDNEKDMMTSFKSALTELFQKHVDKWKENEKPPPKKEDVVEMMKYICSKIPYHLLEVINFIDMSTMHQAIVHKGPKASIELEFKADPEKGDESPINSLLFQFTGDMERQYFIQQIIEYVDPQESDEEDEDKKEEKKAAQDADDDEDQLDAGSDDFEVTPRIYD